MTAGGRCDVEEPDDETGGEEDVSGPTGGGDIVGCEEGVAAETMRQNGHDILEGNPRKGILRLGKISARCILMLMFQMPLAALSPTPQVFHIDRKVEF